MKKIISLIAAGALAVSSSAAPTPTYPGGEEAMTSYITENLVYPDDAKVNGIEGTVEVGFTVNPDGTLSQIKILRMIDPELEAEAIRLVKNMPKWTPADNNGVPKAAPATVKIKFALE